MLVLRKLKTLEVFHPQQASLSLSPQPIKKFATLSSVSSDDGLGSVDVSKLTLQIERVIEDSEACNQFLKFLTKTQSQDELLFLLALDMVKKCDTEKNKRNLSIDIFRRFILRNAPQEINLSNAVKAPIEEHFFKLLRCGIKKVDPNETDRIFNNARVEVLHMLSNHSLPLFKQSQGFQDWISKQKTSYIRKLTASIENCVLNTSKECRSKYVLDPSLSPQIKDRDIAFLLQCATKTDADSEFMEEIMLSTLGFRIYMAKTLSDLGQCKDMLMTKRVSSFHYPIEAVLHTRLDIVIANSFAPEVNIPVEYLRISPNKGYSLSIQRRTVYYPKIRKLKRRDYCLASTLVHDPDTNTYIIVYKSCTYHKVPSMQKWNRSNMIQAEIYQPIGREKTRVTEILFMSMDGLNKSSMRKYISERAKNEHASMADWLQRNSIRRFPKPEYTNNLGICLEDFVNSKRGCTWKDVNRAIVFE